MALIEWRRQVLEIMELMTDLVECVNNDTKEVICDTVGRCSSGHATSSPLDEIEEDFPVAGWGCVCCSIDRARESLFFLSAPPLTH